MKVVRVDSKASQIKFKPVGKRVVGRPTRRSAMSVPDSIFPEQGAHPEEMDPSEAHPCSFDSQRSMYKYTLIEDTRVSRFTHHQIVLVQKNILVLALLVIFFGMIKIEADSLYPSGDVSTKIMITITCTTCMLVLLVVFRSLLILQMELDQRRVYARKDQREDCRTSLCKLFRERALWSGLLWQIAMILPHPMYPLQGIQYTVFDETLQVEFVYEINDLLNVLMMAKVYLVLRSLVSLSIYSSPRAIRLCSYNNIDHSMFFTLKCIQQQYPLATTTVVSLICMFLLGIGFRVTQGNLYFLNQSKLASKTGFQDYGTCLWFSFITMTSIGYGDYVPITWIGKLLAAFIAIFGVMLNSFLVVALTEYLKMKTGQIRSHTTLYRLGQQKRLYRESAGVLAETIQTTQNISEHKFDPMIIKRLKPIFQGLKGRIDKTKARSSWIKSIVPQENKTELMIHEFELVKDHFKELFNLQKKLKGRIQKIEQLKGRKVNEDVHRCFMLEVDYLLQKYKKD